MRIHQWLAQWSSWGWPLLANHLWLATLLSLIALGAVALLRRAPGRARYAVLLIASAKFALPSAVFASASSRLGFDLSSLFSSKTPTEAPAFVYQLTAPLVQFEASAGSGAQAAPGHNELLCLLSLISMTVTSVLLLLWWRDRRRFRFATGSGSVIGTTRERLAMDRVRSWLGLKQEVRLLALPNRIEPGVWGVFKPVLVLPDTMAGQLTDAELEQVMMHEMIHIARWDNLVANLHRMLCCLLWFHPVVWVLDRLLIAERERACDDEVIRLGGTSAVYAASLLKVLRFCLGWNVAGASNATGSNLGRRVERIMSGNVQTNLSMWHRVAVCSIATLVVVLSIAAGLLTRTSAVAQNKAPDRGIIEGVPGGVPGGVGAFQTIRIADLVESGTEGTVVRWLKQVGDIVNRDEPLVEISIANQDVKLAAPTSGVLTRITVQEGQTVPATATIAIIAIATGVPGGIPGGVRDGIPGGIPDGVPDRVAGVVTPYGWAVEGNHLIAILQQEPEISIEFKNSAKSPLSITEAKVKQSHGEKDAPGNLYAVLPLVTVSNTTDRRVKGFTLEFRNGSERRAYYERIPSSIEARGVYTSGRQNRFVVLAGGASGWTVRVAGVLFEDGDAWGMVPPPLPPPPPPQPRTPESAKPPPPPPPPPPSAESLKLIQKASGVLVTSAIKRVEPEYPSQAKASNVSGTVQVEITIDEAGNVVSARAVSGHPLLKAAAVDAARQWQFLPTTLSGEPVKVAGTLTFNFAL